MRTDAAAPFDGARHHRAFIGAIVGIAALTALFGWRQNQGSAVGGPISVAKTFWLGYALVMFYVVPLFLWRDGALDPHVRRIFGWVAASFAVRAVVELWVIYFTRGWRCEYGMAHDVLTLLLIVALRRDARGLPDERSRDALALATLLQLTLVIEAFMAWSFSKLASPAEGIYFAADTDHFAFVNRASFLAVGVGAPLVTYLVARLGKGRGMRTSSLESSTHAARE